MTPSDLLMDLVDRGVRLKVVDDRLVYVAPQGTMTAALVEQLKEQKAEVIALIARRMCRTCGSAGRCERRVPIDGGGWSCQAALDAGLLSDPRADEDDRQRRHERYAHGGRPVDWWSRDEEMICSTCHPPAEESGCAAAPTISESVTDPQSPRPVDARSGCGEMVPTRTAAGPAWVRCTGPDTCDGVCTGIKAEVEAAS